MYDILFIAFALTAVAGLGLIAARLIADRLVAMRSARLRTHLDWVNPQMVTGHRRMKRRR